MPSRRSPLRALGQGLRIALHLHAPRRPSAPHRAAAPLSLAAVVGVMTAAVVTGQPTAGFSAAAAAAGRGSSAAMTGTTLVRVTGPDDVARALGALTPPDERTVERASRAEPRLPLHLWVRPNAGPLASPFGMRWGRLHAGIDLAGPYGSPILAATDGCITYAGPEEGYGEVLKITDWDGTETLYGHMSAFVRRSGCVKAGDVIARVGAAGDATGPHLHFEVHMGGKPIDPIPFLANRGLTI